MPRDKKDTPEAGDNGEREAEVLKGTEEIEKGADELQFPEAGQIIQDLALHNLEQFKHRPKPWDQLSQAEQRDLYAALSANAKETVRRLVEALAAQQREPIRALLESYTEKDDIKVTLKVKTFNEDEALAAVVGLHKAQGKHVLITVASADDYDHGEHDPSQPEQQDLGFEAGTDAHPEDNSDLADAGGDPANLRDGDAVAFAGASGRCRINLVSGWVQFLEDGEPDTEANWQDMREATPAELAAERERTADFADA